MPGGSKLSGTLGGKVLGWWVEEEGGMGIGGMYGWDGWGVVDGVLAEARLRKYWQ